MAELFAPREASGTAWIPDQSPMFGIERTIGPWTAMIDGSAFGVGQSADNMDSGCRRTIAIELQLKRALFKSVNDNRGGRLGWSKHIARCADSAPLLNREVLESRKIDCDLSIDIRNANTSWAICERCGSGASSMAFSFTTRSSTC